MAAGISATSSRNRVPPWACSRRPGRDAVAPVNAPASWPKSSEATSSSETAPQSTATKGPSLRGP